MKCGICGNTQGNMEFIVKEMMFGLRDEFPYFQCANCGCLQIKDIPDDIFKYYTGAYVPFNVCPGKCSSAIERIARRSRAHYAVFNEGVVGKFFYRHFANNKPLRSLSMLNLTKDSRILDVGCGSGYLLYSLAELGFNHLLGIDSYIEKDISYANGLNILKKSISDVQGEFHVIMFHHSFEHMNSPFNILQVVKRLLSSDGICLIRIPVVDSWAWENYGTDWVQIDAPRHFLLHSKKSMQILANRAGFRIKEIDYDSTEFQFWGSEQYKRDVPLFSGNSPTFSCSKPCFSKQKMRTLRREADKLNSENKGDQAAFYLEAL